MSSSRDSGSSQSTNTWRMSRSSVSSDMSRAGSAYGGARGKNAPPASAATAEAPPSLGAAAGAAVAGGAIAAAAAAGTGKFSALAQRTQQARAAAAAAAASGLSKPPVARTLTSDSDAYMSAKPKLIRQTAILADGDSTSSGKSVTFKDTAPTPSESRQQLLEAMAEAQQQAAAAAAAANPDQAAVGQPHQCPVHSADYLAALQSQYRSLYNQLIESNQEDEESDMEASDDEVHGDPESDHLPLGTTYRTITAAAQAVQAAQAQATGLVLMGPTFAPPTSLPVQPPSAAQEPLERTVSSASSTAVGTGGVASFLPRKLSTISSMGSSAGKEEEAGAAAAPSNETRAIIEQSTEPNDEDEDGDEREALLARSSLPTPRIVSSVSASSALTSTGAKKDSEPTKSKIKKPYYHTDL